MGRDWIYGGYWDEDSLRRTVAYREGGKWVPLPFSGYETSVASDLEMFGDTLYIVGGFGDIVIDGSSDTLPSTGVVKWHDDSLWTNRPNTITVGSRGDISTSGDSILIWGASYRNASQLIYTQFMSPDGGQTWQYPYSMIHPTDTIPDFGAEYRLEILDNGDILTINNGTSSGSKFKGLIRWDGQQWHTYGNGLHGAYSRVFDFEFYKDELYMGGSFSKEDIPNDPGRFIVRWDGIQWQEVGGGLIGFVDDLFVADSVLFARVDGGYSVDHRFGDAAIPYLAGWDGTQWCGTPTVFTQTAPQNFGVINDTLYASFRSPGVINGDTVGYLAYFDGDYLHGPDAICSTPGLGEEEPSLAQEEIKIYPSPAYELLSIVLPQQPKEATYELLALDGELIQKGILTKGENTLRIANKLNGVFLVKIETEIGVVVKKVVLEN